MIVRPFDGKKPHIGERVFSAENAALIGDVEIGNDCSIWYGTHVLEDGYDIRTNQELPNRKIAVVFEARLDVTQFLPSDGFVRAISELKRSHPEVGHRVPITCADAAAAGSGIRGIAHRAVRVALRRASALPFRV